VGLVVSRLQIHDSGVRDATRIEEAGQPVAACFPVPDSIAAITPRVQELLLHIEAWHTQRHLDHVYLFYSQHLSSATNSRTQCGYCPLIRPGCSAYSGSRGLRRRCLPSRWIGSGSSPP
jgi:hypothetical protein